MANYYENSKFQHLFCHTGEYHLLRDPVKIKDCSVVCNDCLKDHKQSCKFCKGSNNQQAEKDENTLKQIKDNAVEITKEIIYYLEESNVITPTDRQELENQCREMNDQIQENVDKAKVQIDNLCNDLKDQLNDIQGKVKVELERVNKDTQKKVEDFTKFANKLETKFTNTRESVTVDNIYECQAHIEELKRLDESFHKILRKVLFEPSDWKPDASYIAPITLPPQFQSS